MRYQVRGNTDRCLGVGSTSVGTQLELYDCDDNNDLRLWALNENEQLVLKANSNRCAERLGSGSTVEIQQCSTGDSSQRVRYDTNNDYELRFTSFGQCMEYSSEDFGENIITLSCDGASNQEWEQVEANGGESDGYELIRLRGTSNRCLGVDGSNHSAFPSFSLRPIIFLISYSFRYGPTPATVVRTRSGVSSTRVESALTTCVIRSEAIPIGVSVLVRRPSARNWSSMIATTTTTSAFGPSTKTNS